MQYLFRIPHNLFVRYRLFRIKLICYLLLPNKPYHMARANKIYNKSINFSKCCVILIQITCNQCTSFSKKELSVGASCVISRGWILTIFICYVMYVRGSNKFKILDVIISSSGIQKSSLRKLE